jgi:hypothetical protein
MMKKGQTSLDAAPSIVIIIGLLFLVMATVALIGDKFGSALISSTTETVTTTVNGEAVNVASFTNGTGYTLAVTTGRDNRNYEIVALYNNTDELLLSGNYTLTGRVLTNATALDGLADMKVNYTYIVTPDTTAYNATSELQTEIGNNTSIAGIILTVSLVGIILTILIGVFTGIRRPRI